MKLNENILVPLYYQLKQIIKEKILSGEWKVNERIPSESELCDEYRISRETVRHAIMELVREGMLHRKQGKGTFVKNPEESQKAGNVRGKAIGLVIPYMRQGGPEIVSGVENMVHSRGYHLNLSNTNSSLTEEKSRIEWLIESGIKGLVIYTLQHKDDYEILVKMKETHFPFVLVDRYVREFESDYVVSDNFKGSYEATKHLINLGHKRIAFISNPALSYITSVGDRFLGYKKALEEYNINFDPRLVFICQSKIGVKYPKLGENTNFTEVKRNIAQTLLSLPHPPTAAFVIHDFLALELYKHCKQIGLKVGKDLAIVSFDDTEIATHLAVPLTSVRQSFYDMGEIAAKTLIDKIEGRDNKVKKVILPVKLMVRQSCGTKKKLKLS
ncbi:GntR family transcriptional regulator [Candidatus Aerophobetes bacterium]|nr:GntR family transcriptional regulator [Candidatus Aerophobetes bacterium]